MQAAFGDSDNAKAACTFQPIHMERLFVKGHYETFPRTHQEVFLSPCSRRADGLCGTMGKWAERAAFVFHLVVVGAAVAE